MKESPLLLYLPRVHFVPGQPVFGSVNLNFPKARKVTELSVSLVGLIATHITVSRPSSSSQGGSQSVTQRSTKYFVKQKIHFERDVDIQGEKQYRFFFKLPPNCPPSVKGLIGGIQYLLTAEVKIHHKIPLKAQAELVVVALASAGMKVNARTTEDITPRVTLSVSSNVTSPIGALQGQFVVQQLEKLRSVQFSLEVEEWGRAQSLTRSAKNEFALGTLSPDQVRENQPVPFNIHLNNLDRVPTFADAEIFSVKTALKIKLDIPWKKDVNILVPVVIGYASTSEAMQNIKNYRLANDAKRIVVFDASLNEADFTPKPTVGFSDEEAAGQLKPE